MLSPSSTNDTDNGRDASETASATPPCGLEVPGVVGPHDEPDARVDAIADPLGVTVAEEDLNAPRVKRARRAEAPHRPVPVAARVA